MSTYSADILATAGLVAYWRLGESVGTSAADAKGTNTGTYVNTPSLAQTGALSGDADTAVKFTAASNQYVSVPDATALDLGDVLTVEAWIKCTANQGITRAIVAKGTNAYYLRMGSGNTVEFLKDRVSSIVASTTTITDTTMFHHVVATKNGATNKIYIDGADVTGAVTNATLADTAVQLTIGVDTTLVNDFADLFIDEVALYNVALSAATVLDHYQAGTLTGSYGPPVGTRTVLPPLSLSVDVTLADGSRQRWDSDTRAADRPQGLQFRTRQGDGFSDASVTLSRRIDRDYIDLNLLDDIAFIGDDGTTAYEGRVAGIPRSFGDMHSVSVNCAGWMAHARDRKFTEVYIDRDLSAWLPPSTTLVASELATAGGYRVDGPGTVTPDDSGFPALVQTYQGPWGTGGLPEHIAIYDAGPGLTIGSIYYNFTFSDSADANETVRIGNNLLDTLGGTGEVSGNLRAATGSGYYSFTTPRRYAFLQRYYANVAFAGVASYNLTWRNLAVYGSALPGTAAGSHGSDPGGFYASEVINNIVSRFCPRLNTTGVQSTTYPIPHLVFKDPTDPYDAFLQVNKFHLWDLGVWENKTLYFRPNDLSDYDWEIRLSDLGTTIDLQGDSADDLANGIAVNYTNVATGRQSRITPTDDTTLADTSTSNPVNTHGLTKWTELTLSAPTTAAAAAQIGRIALAEFNLPKAPGTITVTGHIKDRAGHWQQGWRVRAGDTVAITDHPNDRPRLVTETTWDHDSKTLTISVEGPAHRLDAVLDRITTDLVAANLS